MRRLIVFVVAFALGALAVQGQESDRERELSEQIDKLSQLLEARAKRTRGPREHRVTLKVYEVADLVRTYQDTRLVETNVIPSKYQPPEMEEAPEPSSVFEIDQLVEMIQMAVEPASWDEIVGSEIQVNFSRLFVKTLPRIHRRIERMLDWCRKHKDRYIEVDVVAVPVAAGDLALLASRPRELDADQAERLLSRKPLGTIHISGFDGQMLSQEHGRKIAYLQDYDVEIAEGAKVGDPIGQKIFEGFAAEVQPCLDLGAKGVLMHCRLQLTDVGEPLPRHRTEHGEVELPVMTLTRVNTSFWAPLGKTVVAGGCTVGKKPCVLLVTARRLTEEK